MENKFPINESSETKKLFTQRTIGVATFFGGPMAAGLLVRQNYINIGKRKYGYHSLLIGFVSTVLLFIGVFSIPDNVNIPNQAIPAIYTAIIYFIVEKLQGKALREHKETGGEFYSIWKGIAIGALCMVGILVCIFIYVYKFQGNDYNEKYDDGIREFSRNEKEALHLFEIIDLTPKDESIKYIDTKGIPNWNKNIGIINRLDSLKGIDYRLKNQNKVFKEYCQLRIKSYQLVRKALLENNLDKYRMEIQELNNKIKEKLSKI